MFTEFDEQSDTKEQALALLREKISEVRQGLESYGVVNGYEIAAIRKGCTATEIDAAWKEGSHD